jgi:energy-converting hydrogenase Eha subunit E
VITGPVTAPVETLGDGFAEPVLTVSGACDNYYLGTRLAYPTPGATLASQASVYDVRSGAAETVMKGYVDANLGPGAFDPLRRLANLTLEADSHRGASVAFSARFDNLLTLLQKLAVTGGVGFKVQQVGGGLVFSVYEPADRSASVRFSRTTGSLGSYQYQLTAPTGTTAIVGDGGSGVGRRFTSYTDTTAESDWGLRVEVFVDMASTTDVTQVIQGGQQALDSGSPQAQVTFAPRDTPQASYGSDYALGDTVTVQTGSRQLVDVVREVSLTDDTTSGVTVSPTVGGSQAADASATPTIYRQLRSALVAIGLLQRRR